MTEKEKTQGWKYVIDLFYNEVVESVTRYIKGKGYGEDPETYLKKQLAHWEENLTNMVRSERGNAISAYKERLSEQEARIFEMLNCYEVDARNIENGKTYLDSSDANRLARAIIHSIKENS